MGKSLNFSIIPENPFRCLMFTILNLLFSLRLGETDERKNKISRHIRRSSAFEGF